MLNMRLTKILYYFAESYWDIFKLWKCFNTRITSCEIKKYVLYQSIKKYQIWNFSPKMSILIVIYTCKKFTFWRLVAITWSFGYLWWAWKLLKTSYCFAILPFRFENFFQTRITSCRLKISKKFRWPFLFIYIWSLWFGSFWAITVSIERVLYWIMIFSDTYPKAYAYVYLRDFDKSERNMFMYLLEEISQKRAFSVDPPSRFDRGGIVTRAALYRLLHP